VARKIPDGFISGHANQARITTFPKNDAENCLYADDVIRFAREKGYFHGSNEEFSFADTYAPLNFIGARFCEARVWSAFRRVNSDMEQYKEYAMGNDLKNRMPLWIKPDQKLTQHDVMELMRDYYQDTPMDLTTDIGAGPYACIVRWRPLIWEVDDKQYFNERAISTQQTAFSFVAQMRNWLPNSVGGILWFGVDDTYSTVYNPIYCGITEVPSSYAVGNGALMEFSDSSAFWAFNQVSNFAYTRYNLIIPDIKEKQAKLEADYISQTDSIDRKAVELLQQDDAAEGFRFLTDYSVKTANATVNVWKELYKKLFVKYMDGNIKTPVDGQKVPKLEQPGYGVEWYRKLIDQTGDTYLLPESEQGH
jgi:dipeptidase